MTTIVLNTQTGAVSEYSRFDFQALTPTHAGAAVGLFALGGDTDAGEPIVAELRTPPALQGATLKKAMGFVYLAMRGQGLGELTVFGHAQAWRYQALIAPQGMTRFQTGKGVRETYLALGFRNLAGTPFQIDRIEGLTPTSERRI